MEIIEFPHINSRREVGGKLVCTGIQVFSIMAATSWLFQWWSAIEQLMKVFFMVFFSFWTGASGALQLNTGLVNGDLVLVSLNCYACKLIEATTQSPYSHVGIIENRGGKLFVIMAVEPVVMEVPLEQLLQRAQGPPLIMRVKDPQNSNVGEQGLAKAKTYLGRPYDNNFVLGDDKLYCSELIYYSFPQIPFRLKVMHFAPYTEQWTQVMGHPPPEGQWGISPGDIANSPFLEKIPLN